MTDIPTRRSAPDQVWEVPAEREAGPGFPWWTMLLLGVLSTLFGIAVLVWPHATLHVLAVLVGIWLLVAGIFRIIGAFLPGFGTGRQVLSGIVGVILVIGGVACLRNLVTALAVLVFMVSLSWIFSGMAEIVAGFQVRGGMRAALLLLGILSVLIGVVFVVWPGLTLTVLVLMIGITAIVIGVGELVLAFRLRKVLA